MQTSFTVIITDLKAGINAHKHKLINIYYAYKHNIYYTYIMHICTTF